MAVGLAVTSAVCAAWALVMMGTNDGGRVGVGQLRRARVRDRREGSIGPSRNDARRCVVASSSGRRSVARGRTERMRGRRRGGGRSRETRPRGRESRTWSWRRTSRRVRGHARGGCAPRKRAIGYLHGRGSPRRSAKADSDWWTRSTEPAGVKLRALGRIDRRPARSHRGSARRLDQIDRRRIDLRTGFRTPRGARFRKRAAFWASGRWFSLRAARATASSRRRCPPPRATASATRNTTPAATPPSPLAASTRSPERMVRRTAAP